MSAAKPIRERVREAVAVARQQEAGGIYPKPPPADHKTLTQLSAEAKGVTLSEPARHSELDVYVSGVVPGSLTDRAEKTNATKTKKPARTQ